MFFRRNATGTSDAAGWRPVMRALPLLVVLLATACSAAPERDPLEGEKSGHDALCPSVPACDSPPPDPGATASWEHWKSHVIALASPNHRGRDAILTPTDSQTASAKFAYGIVDKDLEDEVVDVYLDRGCQGAWELLGDGRTSDEGRLDFAIPDDQALETGRHRVHFVVRGDGSATDLYIQVVNPGAHTFVSDVDGTLTTSEYVEFGKLLTGSLPDAHEDAALALGTLASHGYLPIYLTARPEWLVQRTRDFLSERGFPPGIIHTTQSLTGAVGGSAETFKAGELADLGARGIVPEWAFGNQPSDTDAYDGAGIQPIDHRVFYQLDDPHGGRRIEAYGDLLDELGALPDACAP